MKSRYGIGDRVVLHGYPAMPPGHRRDGFVGTVGATPLIRIASLSDATGCTILGKAERKFRAACFNIMQGSLFIATDGEVEPDRTEPNKAAQMTARIDALAANAQADADNAAADAALRAVIGDTSQLG